MPQCHHQTGNLFYCLMLVCFFLPDCFLILSLFTYTTVSVRSNYSKNSDFELVYQRVELDTPGWVLTFVQFSYPTFTISNATLLHQGHAGNGARAGNLSGFSETHVTSYIFICFFSNLPVLSNHCLS